MDPKKFVQKIQEQVILFLKLQNYDIKITFKETIIVKINSYIYMINIYEDKYNIYGTLGFTIEKKYIAEKHIEPTNKENSHIIIANEICKELFKRLL